MHCCSNLIENDKTQGSVKINAKSSTNSCLKTSFRLTDNFNFKLMKLSCIDVLNQTLCSLGGGNLRLRCDQRLRTVLEAWIEGKKNSVCGRLLCFRRGYAKKRGYELVDCTSHCMKIKKRMERSCPLKAHVLLISLPCFY